MTVVLGEVENQAFSEAIDSAGTSYGTTVCGPRTYEILNFGVGTTASVASVEVVDAASGSYNIKATSNDEANQGNQNLVLRVTFTNYPLTTNAAFPKAETSFALYISEASCNCNLITWDNPAVLTLTTGLMTSPADTLSFVKAEANEASKSASPAIRACYKNGVSNCILSATISIVDDDTGTLDSAFMSVAG
jgi:hypothetical protein